MSEHPHSYLMHIRTNHCATCNATEQWSETLRVSFDPIAGTRHLEPLRGSTLDPTLPIGISRLPTRSIPLCHCCVLKHAPAAPDYTPEQRWRETLQRKTAEQRPTTAAPSPRSTTRIIAGVDQL